MVNYIRLVFKKILPKDLFKKFKKLYIRLLLFLYPKGFFKKVSYLNKTFFINLNLNNGGVDSEIYLHGVYEPYVLSLLKNNINIGDVYVDIGANIGQHSLFVSRLVGDTGKVIAFEPLKNIFDQFHNSIDKNNFKNITIYNNGCGEKEEKLPIYSTNENMGASSVFKTKGKEIAGNIDIIIPDPILSKEERVDLIKIDVEGYELEVLRGLKETISKYKPKIFLEYSPYYYKLTDYKKGLDIIKFLKENNYHVYDIENKFDVEILSFDKYITEKIEQTNFLCTNKNHA